MVDELVQLDRVPQANPLSGSLLLRQAWSQHDVVVHLAQYYKRWSKTLYIVQLILAWLLVLATTLRNSLCYGPLSPRITLESMDADGDGNVSASELSDYLVRSGSADDACVSHFQTGIFCTASVASFILFLDNMYFSTKRWRQLRSGAGSLDSIIWMYRARSGPFQTDKAEEVLNEILGNWMDDLVAGADLSRTSIARIYPPAIYTHCQFAGQLSPLDSGVTDDFHSPVQPERYIALRLKPMMNFYQLRIPEYSRAATLMLLMLGVFSIFASALAFFGYADIVVVVTAAGASVTSYLEFADTQRKIERYTHAVRSIQKLLNWWMTLEAVERAGVEATSQLLSMGESIISEERLAWQPMNIGLGIHDDNEKEGRQKGEHTIDFDHGDRGGNKVHPDQ